MQSYDVIVVGGGMVGLSFALAVVQATPLSVLVLEANASNPPWDAAQTYHRVSAIALSSMRIFKSLGCWEGICQRRVSPFKKIMVWDRENATSLQFDSQEIASPWLGYIIENNAIQAALADKLSSSDRVTYLRGMALKTVTVDAQQVILQAQDGRRFSAPLAVAADGKYSWLRQQAGISCQQQDYHQSAIVATIGTALPHQCAARQVFLSSGPLAFLPLQDAHQSSIVWSLPTGAAEDVMHAAEDDFLQALARAFGSRLGALSLLSKRHCFPLTQQQAKHYIADRIALMGDAAHSVHPLAGQGVNMGLLDAASLLELVKQAHAVGRDIGGRQLLRRYERWRKGDNFLMYHGVDALKKVFASEYKWASALRRTGFDMLMQADFIKNTFTCHAVGERAGLPSLAC